MRPVIAFCFFFGLWLLLSGVYKALMIVFGLLSVCLVIIILRRINLLLPDSVSRRHNYLSMLSYIFWLFLEIVKSNFAAALNDN